MVSISVEDSQFLVPLESGPLWPASTFLIPVIGILIVVLAAKYGGKGVGYVKRLFKQYKTYPGDIGN